ncbi:hypothetical protein [Sphingomonas hengshuiensis]|uniref:hypothetical protein n=1 Tax=Sphingomonas hengshuiensis TaxID=1609977 RepID=UPI000A86013D|nr:hypothetical protein [Sphingomonas hengshuiensis]
MLDVSLIRRVASAPPAYPAILGNGVAVSPGFLVQVADAIETGQRAVVELAALKGVVA